MKQKTLINRKLSELSEDNLKRVNTYLDKLAEYQEAMEHLVNVAGEVSKLEVAAEGGKHQCAFCKKRLMQVQRMVVGPENICICDECVKQCQEVINDSMKSEVANEEQN